MNKTLKDGNNRPLAQKTLLSEAWRKLALKPLTYKRLAAK